MHLQENTPEYLEKLSPSKVQDSETEDATKAQDMQFLENIAQAFEHLDSRDKDEMIDPALQAMDNVQNNILMPDGQLYQEFEEIFSDTKGTFAAISELTETCAYKARQLLTEENSEEQESLLTELHSLDEDLRDAVTTAKNKIDEIEEFTSKLQYAMDEHEERFGSLRYLFQDPDEDPILPLTLARTQLDEFITNASKTSQLFEDEFSDYTQRQQNLTASGN